MNENLDKKIDESVEPKKKSFSELIREGKERVGEMLKEADDLQKRLNDFGGSRERS